jgi:23S rRNA pseudouridine1911/1915/1917 synthase
MIITVSEDDASIRIDKYLSDHDSAHSRSNIQKAIRSGQCKVNGAIVRDSYMVKKNDVIEFKLPDPVEAEIVPENIPLDILYEDDDVLVVNKPKDMVVHPAPGHLGSTLVNAIMYHCGDSLSGINGVMRPGIVHRIDKDTTGSLIICKNDYSHRFIAEQIKEHTVNRIYLGIVHGRTEPDGTIDKPIGRNPSDRKKMAVNTVNGKRAVTHYKTIKQSSRFSFCKFRLETGRTHQIRVHMASIGHPLLGDSVYGPAKCPVSGLQGQTLHAWKIGFIHPGTGEYMEFTAPVPDYMMDLIRKI